MPSYNRKRGIVRYSDTGAAAAAGETNALFLYLFDENSTTTFVDSVTGLNAVLTDTGTVSSSTTGVPTGVTRWVRVDGATGAGKGFDGPKVINGNSDWTIEVTFRQDDVDATAIGMFIHDGANSDTAGGNHMGVYTHSTCQLIINGISYDSQPSGTSDNTVFNLCLMRNGNRLYAFIDGTLITTKNISGLGVTFSSDCYASVARRAPADPNASGNFYVTNFRGFASAIYPASGYTIPTLPLTTTVS